MTSNDDGAPNADRNDAVAQAGNAIGQMTQGEQLVGLGALLLVLSDILGDIMLDEYGVGSLLWGTAILAVMALWARRLRGGDLPIRYEWVLGVLGMAAGIFGVRELLGDLENNLFDAGGGTVFFAFFTYIGAAVLAFGGYRLSKS